MINYQTYNSEMIFVFLYKKFVGTIEKVDGGYQYIVKGGKYKGEVFSSIELVKESLEGDND